MSPRLTPGSAAASSQAASKSKVSGRSRLSRESSDLRSLAISSSPKPERVMSTSGVSLSSARSRARSSWSQSPLIRFRARLRSLACSGERSTKMTGTLAKPRRLAASSRWWPPMTARSSRRAMMGSTNPNSWMLLVRASSSCSAIRRGLKGSGLSRSSSTCSIVRCVLLSSSPSTATRPPPPC